MLLSVSRGFLTKVYLPGICLDLDWLDEELFASCSADKVIHVLSVNRAEPVAILTWEPVSMTYTTLTLTVL